MTANFDEEELANAAENAFTLDVAGWDTLFDGLGFKAWRRSQAARDSFRDEYIYRIKCLKSFELGEFSCPP